MADRPILVIGNKNYSTWSLRPWIFLKTSGLVFEERRLPLFTPEFTAEIGKVSPTGKVPVLIHGPTRVWESLAICQYAAHAFAVPHAWPQDLEACGAALAVSSEMHAGFGALRNEMPMNCRKHQPGLHFTAAAWRDVERVQALWADCRGRFGSQGPFLFGEFTIADAMYAPVVFRFKTYAVELGPVQRDYADAMLALPGMVEWLAAGREETEIVIEDERM